MSEPHSHPRGPALAGRAGSVFWDWTPGALAVLGLVFVLTLVPAGRARAAFSPATLLSNSSPLQFEEASSPAFSENGEYVAFRGTLAGVSGIYRRDLSTHEVELVAGANSQAELDAPDAAAPSISLEGRFVAFTTAHDLDAAQDTGSGCPEVYVRDMDVPLTLTDRAAEEQGRPPPFALASAANGTSRGLEYEKPCSPGSGGALALAGAQAAPGVALAVNKDGQPLVAFTVLSPSDLAGPCAGTPVKCPTEPSQVAVRDLATRTTTVVSVTPAGEPTRGGGAYPSSASAARGASSGEGETDSTAAISAEGDAVAWQGTNVPEQVPSAAAEVTSATAKFGGPGLEVEPLWRELGASGAATERLLAGAGLDFYFQGSHNNTGDNVTVESGANAPLANSLPPVPALSANGEEVVTTANAPTAANEASYQYASDEPPPADAYLIDAGPGRSPRVTPLTATPDFAAVNADIDGVSDIAISPDGTRVAFNTRRTSFALQPPTLVSPPAPETGDAYTYLADVATGTLQQVTSTYDGASPDGQPGQLSLGGPEGRALAFASTAANLFYGDVTPGVSQVLLSEELPTGESPPAQGEVPPVPPLPLSPEWVLSVSASPEAGGGVLVRANVPGAGLLRVAASAQLPAGAAKGRKAGRGGGGKMEGAGGKDDTRRDTPSRARAPARITKAKSKGGVRIVTATVARASSSPGAPGEVDLHLRAGAAYSSLVDSKLGLYTLLTVTFTAPGRPPLTRQIAAIFHRATPAKGAKRAKTARRPKPKPKTGKAGPSAARGGAGR